jgi:hypothetical protein
MSWLKAIFSFLGELFKVISQKQLLDAGEAKAEVRQYEMDNKAQAKTKEIVKASSVLSFADKRDKLRKLDK